MNEKKIVVGAFHEILELAEADGVGIAGLIDNDKTGSYRNIPIVCTDQEAGSLPASLKKCPVIITPDKPELRRKLKAYYGSLGFAFSSLISKEARISPSAEIGLGSVVQAGVNISAECRIGEFVKLNSMCNVMHDAVIGEFSTIAPNAVILGKVKIGRECYIGANATILPGITVHDHAVIGAGSVVTRDVPASSVVAGNPARPLKNKSVDADK